MIANSFHVDALGDLDDCASTIVRRFTATLKAGDVSCAPKVKAVRLTPVLPAARGGGHPGRAVAWATPRRPRERSLASAAMQTAADALARWYINYSGTDQGLRGGTWKWTQDGAIARFTFLTDALGAGSGRLRARRAGTSTTARSPPS